MCVNSYNIDILKMEYTQASSKLQYLDDQANKYISYILAFIGALAGFLGLLMKDGMPTNYIAIALIISAGALIIGLLIIVKDCLGTHHLRTGHAHIKPCA